MAAPDYLEFQLFSEGTLLPGIEWQRGIKLPHFIPHFPLAAVNPLIGAQITI